MKQFKFIILTITAGLLASCDFGGNEEITGTQSPMGEVGVTVSTSTSTIAGVSNFAGEVVSNTNGTSTYNATATVTNEAIKNFFSNVPGVTVNGNQITVEGIQFKNTTKGIELKTGPSSGIIMKYDVNAGDKLPIGSTGANREVISKSTTDDYQYGFYNIKVVQIEESTTWLKASPGITKITYYGNHKFGLVGVVLTFDDQTTAKFPVYTSTQN